jgi:hypothetical protein
MNIGLAGLPIVGTVPRNTGQRFTAYCKGIDFTQTQSIFIPLNPEARYIPVSAKVISDAIAALSGGATCNLQVVQKGVATAASLASGTSNAEVLFTARTPGVGGNSITVTLVNPMADNAVLGIVVVGKAITINLATGSGGAITTTAAQVVAAINASTGGTALLTTAQGNNQDLTFTAVNAGVAGNDIAISYVNQGIPNAALSVQVQGTNIVVYLATLNGAVTSTAAQIATAMAANAAAAALVGVADAAGSNGSGVVAPFAQTNLSGGNATYNAAGNLVVASLPSGDSGASAVAAHSVASLAGGIPYTVLQTISSSAALSNTDAVNQMQALALIATTNAIPPGSSLLLNITGASTATTDKKDLFVDLIGT